jgi:hypothetical protein
MGTPLPQLPSRLQDTPRYDVERVQPGSVPASVRNAFLDLINDERQGEEACRLVEQVSTCTDVLPYEYCEMLDLPDGTTFAEAAAKVRLTLDCA